MSALSAVEAPIPDQPDAATTGTPALAAAGGRLRLVELVTIPERRSLDRVTPAEVEPSASSSAAVSLPGQAGEVLTPSAVIAPRPVRARTRVTSPPPLRLTRRGRVVVAVLSVAVIAAVALVVGLAAAGGAQATSHGQPGGGYQGMHEIVVRPGQTLWSIASAAEPGADTWQVVQQIMTANAMTGTTISAGQLLWVPR